MRYSLAALVTSLSLASLATASTCDKKQCMKDPKACTCAMGNKEGHGTHMKDGEHEAHGFMSALEKLGLTEDQRKQVESIHAKYAERHHNSAKPMAAAELAADHKEMIEKIRAILTPEQKQKLETLLPAPKK